MADSADHPTPDPRPSRAREPDPDNVGDYLISARSFDEYRAMFDLSPTDLAGSILDCPGGGSSFTHGAGARAVAADPVYALPAAQLAQIVRAEPDRGTAHTMAGQDRYRWDFYGGPDGHRTHRRTSAETFLRDRDAHPDRYLPMALPDLNFEDGQFDLVLSSHFLFTYADRLDHAFHLDALLELHRVAGYEARVFPLRDQAGRSLDRLVTDVRTDLAERNVRTEIRTVPYEFQRGAHHMLVIPARTSSLSVGPRVGSVRVLTIAKTNSMGSGR